MKAGNMYQSSGGPINHKSRHCLVVILAILSLWCQCSVATIARFNGDMDFNPNIRCPGRNEVNIWHPCKYGGYIVNEDPHNCPDRYVCYRGVGEFCNSGDKCADNAICTVCNICQKCESREKCSDFRLCPGIRMNFFKRFMQKRLIEYNDE